MQGEIISIGTELLLGQTVNTNAAFLGTKAAEYGIDIFRHTVVGDNRVRILSVLSEALGRSEIVFITGGLGPTQDDLTKEVVAEYFGLPLYVNEEVLKDISNFFLRKGIVMPPNNRKQAMFPKEARILPNRLGTAPGMIIEKKGKIAILLPGPPKEMQMMFEEQVSFYLKQRLSGQEAVIKSRVLKIWGMGESQVDEILNDLFNVSSNPTIAYLFRQGEVLVRITAKASTEEEASEHIKVMEERIRTRLKDYVFASDDETIVDIIAKNLLRKKWRIVTAESCTGGLVANFLTNVPGSSAYFEHGFITYSNEAKEELLGIPAKIIETHGAVSEECARAMALGALKNKRANIALAVTGLAGPSGGTPENPIGTVYIAIAHEQGDAYVKKYYFTGEREKIKTMAALTALHFLRQFLLEHE